MAHGIWFFFILVAALGCGADKENEETDTGEEPDSDSDTSTRWYLVSPDETLRVTIELSDLDGEADYPSGARLYYSVEIGGPDKYKESVPPSPLGIVRGDQGFVDDLSFLDKEGPTEIEESYTMTLGKQKECENRANEKSLIFEGADGGQLKLVMRAYNKGFAFRYVFPEEDESEFTVTEEATGFRIPDGSRAWMLDYDEPQDPPNDWYPAYEGNWQNGIDVGTVSGSAIGWSLPALFETEDNEWILLFETDVQASYCGSHLQPEASSNVYRIALPDPKEANDIGEATPVWTLPWEMPWRVLLVTDDIADVIESTLPSDLASPSTVEDTDWIEPGRVSWSWWSEESSPKNYERMADYVDLASEMDWEYTLLDADWPDMTGGTWEDLAAHAEKQGVGLLMWYNGGGDHNSYTQEPRDIMSEPELRRTEFKTLNSAGVKGVKVDFFQSDKQWMMEYYIDILKDAADYEIMVNVHGSTIPRGWQRTYPHLMTAEAIKGAEWYKWDATYAKEAPWRNTILPFTRNAVASMDFTPVTFADSNYAHATSNGHELALSVVFESGWQHFADNVTTYRELEAAPKAFLRHVPTAWDTTKHVDGTPGEFVVIARQRGDEWYVGGIFGTDKASTYTLVFDFLGDGDFDMTLISDGEDSRSFVDTEQTVSTGDEIEISLQPGGGFVAHLVPAE